MMTEPQLCTLIILGLSLGGTAVIVGLLELGEYIFRNKKESV